MSNTRHSKETESKQELDRIAEAFLSTTPKRLWGMSLLKFLHAPYSLELFDRFLRKLKQETGDIQLYSPNNFDPLAICWKEERAGKLSLMLLHGANINRKFIGDRSTPVLLGAMQRRIMGNIRLLIMFGASWENISRDGLNAKDKYSYDNIKDWVKEFHIKVKEDVTAIRHHQALAQQYSFKQDNLNALKEYIESTKGILKFAETCDSEYSDIENLIWVKRCYIHLAMKDLFEALRCLDPLINLTESSESLKILKQIRDDLNNLDIDSEVFEIKVVGSKKIDTINVMTKLSNLINKSEGLDENQGPTKESNKHDIFSCLERPFRYLGKFSFYRSTSSGYKSAYKEEKGEKQLLLPQPR